MQLFKTTRSVGQKTAIGVLLVALVLPLVASPFIAAAEVGGTITRTSQPADVTNPIATIELVTVGPELKDCVGVSPQTCMVVDGNYFYDTIEGFDYEEGYDYKLYINKTARTDVPADANAYQYSLVRIQSKTPATITPTATDDTNLTNILTQLDSILTRYLQVAPWEHHTGTFTFTDNRFTTTASCNTIMGSYKRDGFNLTFSDIASTKKACLDANTAAAEASLIKTLHAVDSFTIINNGINLSGGDQTLTLTR